ncbi:hypothetical protein BT96DRAFT_1024228 [Gymnopus androsaceus JB14]|uniref:Uncharacterized protein n=1 Tax=Gymnopus androsaceus JB14 TaxID=1447944 RepID=A0A6A4GZ11_9AGAR|nr:hypothetical protein BT96DRAFT_1024228 [Gymnopus androsaceus JB14]
MFAEGALPKEELKFDDVENDPRFLALLNDFHDDFLPLSMLSLTVEVPRLLAFAIFSIILHVPRLISFASTRFFP